MREIRLVAITWLTVLHLTREEFAYLFFLNSNGREYDMYGFTMQHLKNTLSQVAL